MDIKQVYQFVNTAAKEVLGEQAIVKEDLSDIVDLGTQLFNANATDAYVRSLVNQIGRVIFVNRKYNGSAPSVLMDGWEYGSVCEKISSRMPDAVENESWELQDGASYDPNVFHKPDVIAKFFNKKVTFEIDLSICEKQVKQSLQSVGQLNAFISMIYNEVDKALTVRVDALVMRTICNMAGEVAYAETSGTISNRTGLKAVNLLYEYNQDNSTNLTADKALKTPEFLKYAAYRLGLYADRLKTISTLFNVGGEARFTPDEARKFVLLSDFAKAVGPYSLSGAYHEGYLKMPDAETVPYWQGSGTDYKLTSTGKIDVKTANGDNITLTGVIGVMFDRDALGVANVDRRVTTNYNAKGEFWNNFYKFDAGYFNDLNENFVVFYLA